jgi:hypothetical protein
MSIPTLTENGETKGGRKRGLNEQRWRAPLLVLFFSLVLILVLSLLILAAWLTLRPAEMAVGPLQVAAPARSARISVDPPAGSVDSELRVAGQGWSPNDVVFVSLEAPGTASDHDFAYAGAVAGDDGKFAVSFSFPNADQWRKPGAIKVVAWAEQSGAKAVTIFQVTTPAGAATPVQVALAANPQAAPDVTATVPTTESVALAPPASPAASQAINWYGEYFANAELSGAPVFVRDDPNVDFDWASSGPGHKIGSDKFSVRWTRQVFFTAGVYRFFARVDDGVRLWVDDKLIIDQWHEAATMTYVSDSYILPGTHRVRVEYYNVAGQSHVRTWWERQEVYPDWKAEYFSGRLPDAKPDLVRNDSQIRFNWSGDAPAPGIQSDNFSVRWTQRTHFDQGLYRFYIRADKGMRIWLDSSLVIDLWNNPGSGLRTVNLSLSEGQYSVRVEYYNLGGSARAELRWDLIASTLAATDMRQAAQQVAIAPTVTPAPRRTSASTPTRSATPTKTTVKVTTKAAATPKPVQTPLPAATEAPTDVPVHALGMAPQTSMTETPTPMGVQIRALAVVTETPASMGVQMRALAVTPQAAATETPVDVPIRALAVAPQASATEAPTDMQVPAQPPSAAPIEIAPATPALPSATPVPTQAPIHIQALSVPERKPSLAVQPSQVAAGADFMIKGQGWHAGDEVIISLVRPGEDLQAAPPFSRAIVEGQGGFTLKVTLPDEPRWADQPELIVLAHSIDWTTRLVTPLHVVTAATPTPAMP